ncbi:GGDEF domain-containing protein [Erythrobacter sp.]|jgi:diguanylate cyclase (GGDEF)-like protein|uniref:GGDEF domain-containing protein n=1 Tax=Erythrobacter sp. TaxID=1042 RepID=UPI002EB4E1DB|nr:GGDEF domain-containing protein [Erythrobacter sp.]
MAGGHFGGEAVALALDPATGLIAAMALAMVVTAFALTRRPPTKASVTRARAAQGALEGLFGTDRFERELRRAARRSQRPYSGESVVMARIDHLHCVERIRGEDMRREAAARVARIMRAGLRRTDKFHTIPGDGFVIVIEGAREAEAAGIAGRLRHVLARTTHSGHGDAMRVTASFGVAERRAGESFDTAQAKAQDALDAAMHCGEDCVVMASEIEEILCLPPPAPSQDGIAAKAA